MNEQTAAPTYFSRKAVRQYCTFEGTDAKSGRVCSSFSLHAFGRSEDDWAFAKRALARGDDPEEVIRRIADYRGPDKHDPEYYARHTVTKALADLRSKAVPDGIPGNLPNANEQEVDRSTIP